tara:strand:+ start:29057 stop:36550 length:7494 start_codon:yes stop_codon:yes gene_type:complete
VQITQKKQLLTYNESVDIQISSLQNLSNIDSIFNFDINGNLKTFVNGNTFQGISELEVGEGYYVLSTDDATFPYTIYPTSESDIPDSVTVDRRTQILTYCGPDFDLINGEFEEAPTTTPSPTTTTPAPPSPVDWETLGGGEKSLDGGFGISIDLSLLTSTRKLVVGRPYHSTGEQEGQVRLYQITGSNFTDISTINGDNDMKIGRNVSLSEDGTSIAYDSTDTSTSSTVSANLAALTFVSDAINSPNSSVSVTIPESVKSQNGWQYISGGGNQNISRPGKLLQLRSSQRKLSIAYGLPQANASRGGAIFATPGADDSWSSEVLEPPNKSIAPNNVADIFGANVSLVDTSTTSANPAKKPVISAPNADFTATQSPSYSSFNGGAVYVDDLRLVDTDPAVAERFGIINDSKGEHTVLGFGSLLRFFTRLSAAGSSNTLSSWNNITPDITLDNIRTNDSSINAGDTISFVDAGISVLGQTVVCLVRNTTQSKLTAYSFKTSSTYDSWTFHSRIHVGTDKAGENAYSAPGYSIVCDNSGSIVVIAKAEADETHKDRLGYIYCYRDTTYSNSIQFNTNNSANSLNKQVLTTYVESASKFRCFGAQSSNGQPVSITMQQSDNGTLWTDSSDAVNVFQGNTISYNEDSSNQGSLVRFMAQATNCPTAFSDYGIIRIPTRTSMISTDTQSVLGLSPGTEASAGVSLFNGRILAKIAQNMLDIECGVLNPAGSTDTLPTKPNDRTEFRPTIHGGNVLRDAESTLLDYGRGSHGVSYDQIYASPYFGKDNFLENGTTPKFTNGADPVSDDPTAHRIAQDFILLAGASHNNAAGAVAFIKLNTPPVTDLVQHNDYEGYNIIVNNFQSGDSFILNSDVAGHDVELYNSAINVSFTDYLNKHTGYAYPSLGNISYSYLSSKTSQDNFGYSVSMHEDKIAIIGAPKVDADSTVKNVYIFERNFDFYGSKNWLPADRLQGVEEHFGRSVACFTFGSSTYIAIASDTNISVYKRNFGIFGNSGFNLIISDDLNQSFGFSDLKFGPFGSTSDPKVHLYCLDKTGNLRTFDVTDINESVNLSTLTIVGGKVTAPYNLGHSDGVIDLAISELDDGTYQTIVFTSSINSTYPQLFFQNPDTTATNNAGAVNQTYARGTGVVYTHKLVTTSFGQSSWKEIAAPKGANDSSLTGGQLGISDAEDSSTADDITPQMVSTNLRHYGRSICSRNDGQVFWIFGDNNEVLSGENLRLNTNSIASNQAHPFEKYYYWNVNDYKAFNYVPPTTTSSTIAPSTEPDVFTAGFKKALLSSSPELVLINNTDDLTYTFAPDDDDMSEFHHLPLVSYRVSESGNTFASWSANSLEPSVSITINNLGVADKTFLIKPFHEETPSGPVGFSFIDYNFTRSIVDCSFSDDGNVLCIIARETKEADDSAISQEAESSSKDYAFIYQFIADDYAPEQTNLKRGWIFMPAISTSLNQEASEFYSDDAGSVIHGVDIAHIPETQAEYAMVMSAGAGAGVAVSSTGLNTSVQEDSSSIRVQVFYLHRSPDPDSLLTDSLVNSKSQAVIQNTELHNYTKMTNAGGFFRRHVPRCSFSGDNLDVFLYAQNSLRNEDNNAFNDNMFCHLAGIVRFSTSLTDTAFNVSNTSHRFNMNLNDGWKTKTTNFFPLSLNAKVSQSVALNDDYAGIIHVGRVTRSGSCVPVTRGDFNSSDSPNIKILELIVDDTENTNPRFIAKDTAPFSIDRNTLPSCNITISENLDKIFLRPIYFYSTVNRSDSRGKSYGEDESFMNWWSNRGFDTALGTVGRLANDRRKNWADYIEDSFKVFSINKQSNDTWAQSVTISSDKVLGGVGSSQKAILQDSKNIIATMIPYITLAPFTSFSYISGFMDGHPQYPARADGASQGGFGLGENNTEILSVHNNTSAGGITQKKHFYPGNLDSLFSTGDQPVQSSNVNIGVSHEASFKVSKDTPVNKHFDFSCAVYLYPYSSAAGVHGDGNDTTINTTDGAVRGNVYNSREMDFIDSSLSDTKYDFSWHIRPLLNIKQTRAISDGNDQFSASVPNMLLPSSDLVQYSHSAPSSFYTVTSDTQSPRQIKIDGAHLLGGFNLWGSPSNPNASSTSSADGKNNLNNITHLIFRPTILGSIQSDGVKYPLVFSDSFRVHDQGSTNDASKSTPSYSNKDYLNLSFGQSLPLSEWSFINVFSLPDVDNPEHSVVYLALNGEITDSYKVADDVLCNMSYFWNAVKYKDMNNHRLVNYNNTTKSYDYKTIDDFGTDQNRLIYKSLNSSGNEVNINASLDSGYYLLKNNMADDFRIHIGDVGAYGVYQWSQANMHSLHLSTLEVDHNSPIRANDFAKFKYRNYSSMNHLSSKNQSYYSPAINSDHELDTVLTDKNAYKPFNYNPYPRDKAPQRVPVNQEYASNASDYEANLEDYVLQTPDVSDIINGLTVPMRAHVIKRVEYTGLMDPLPNDNLLAAGLDNFGQLGQGSRPTQESQTGKLLSAGINTFGQLGDNTSTGT